LQSFAKREGEENLHAAPLGPRQPKNSGEEKAEESKGKRFKSSAGESCGDAHHHCPLRRREEEEKGNIIDTWAKS